MNFSEQTPIIQYVNLLLDQAIEAHASDLHLEPFEQECAVRYRIDGVLYEKKSLPRALALPIISRIKLLANMDISEQRLPQDGRFHRSTSHGSVDFRIATLPTPWGESVVLRLLDRCYLFQDLPSLELSSSLQQELRNFLLQPHGLFVVTGPTGSGKTTTLYTCLQELNKEGKKLMSAEDPVEYEIEGMIQISVEEEIGLSFQRILRSCLRHDPDVIMVGEMRDAVTAQMALQASLTGHLVLTTLHTADTIGAVTRLMNMGLDPLMIAMTLRGVLAQRLVRKICILCNNAGCTHCHHTGYRGRRAIFEMLFMNDELRLLISQRASQDQLREKALELGMKTLCQEGARLLAEGITTEEELVSAGVLTY